MNEVCHDVEIESNLQPLQGESFVNNQTTNEDEAKLDIQANELWGSFSSAFFDKISYPSCKTSRKLLAGSKKHHETKELQISAKLSILIVEPSSICLLIFGCTGAAAPTATTRTMQ